MKCPNCSKDMEVSPYIINTYPATVEFYCDCGLIVDSYDGRCKVCFRSRETFTDERIAELDAMLMSLIESGHRD